MKILENLLRKSWKSLHTLKRTALTFSLIGIIAGHTKELRPDLLQKLDKIENIRYNADSTFGDRLVFKSGRDFYAINDLNEEGTILPNDKPNNLVKYSNCDDFSFEYITEVDGEEELDQILGEWYRNTKRELIQGRIDRFKSLISEEGKADIRVKRDGTNIIKIKRYDQDDLGEQRGLIYISSVKDISSSPGVYVEAGDYYVSGDYNHTLEFSGPNVYIENYEKKLSPIDEELVGGLIRYIIEEKKVSIPKEFNDKDLKNMDLRAPEISVEIRIPSQ